MSVPVRKIAVPRVDYKCSFCNESTAVLEAAGKPYCQWCFNGVVNVAWALSRHEEPEAPTDAEYKQAWLETVMPDFDMLEALERDEEPWSPSLPPR